MSDNVQAPEFSFRDENGWKLCREILKKYLPFTPHDYQLEGVTQALDGIDLIAITATGSGKSAYIYMLVLILQELATNPTINPSNRPFPKDPVVVVISPTLALEEDQVHTMSEFGLTAQAVNTDTKADAASKGQNIWEKATSKKVAVIFVSPEMLTSQGFEGILQRKTFKERIYGLITDEVHLLCTWGGSFRPEFLQIGFMKARFPESTVFIGMTATLRKKPLEGVCKLLGLREGKYHLIRRSNARRDVQIILDWVLREKGKVLIFCSSIRFGFNLAVYLWHVDPKLVAVNHNIRLFNSLNEPGYNTETLDFLRGSDNAKVTISTNKLSVGINVSDFETAVIIDPKDPDDLIQKGGRVGRDRSKVQNPRIIVYISSALMSRANELVNPNPSTTATNTSTSQSRRNKAEVGDEIDPGLARIVTASCIPAAIDMEYDNPIDKPCSSECTTCAENPPPPPRDPCDCSGCQPEETNVSETASAKQRKKVLPLNIRVTKKMKEVGIERLKKFRRDLWRRGDPKETGMIPMNAFLPDSIITALLNGMETLLSKQVLTEVKNNQGSLTEDAASLFSPLIGRNRQLANASVDLLEVLLELHQTYDAMRAQARAAAQAKRAQGKARGKVTETEDAEDAGDDEEQMDYRE